ncbi:MAG: hypothetical protein MUC79_08560 [Thiobacillaceae bacterium]|nr:hypothetical protein [Thiobacillaceae bacterium]
MGKNWIYKLLLLGGGALALPVAAIMSSSSAPVAADEPNPFTTTGACHPMIMESECRTLKTTLATLPAGAERARLLANYRETIAEREAACNPDHQNAAIVYWPQRQAMTGH